ncbi:MAG: FAD-dependent oxidoreductase [Planctomycetota bacterium]
MAERIAIIGSGIGSLSAAHFLNRSHEITVFEAAERLGGHVHTHTIEVDGRELNVDSGFIVLNDRTYPNFHAILRELGVAVRESTMGFSVRCDRTGLEYSGADFGGLFARRRNLISPRFWSLLKDVFAFHDDAKTALSGGDLDRTLGEFLDQHGYGKPFQEQYLIPMGAAIWSAEPERIREFPCGTFLRFFSHHGLLSVKDRPTWQTVVGGSRTYVEALTAQFSDRIRLSTPVLGVRRFDDRVEVRTAAGVESFDQVVIGCHSDQALRMLEDPSDQERDVLSGVQFQSNSAVLHQDPRPMPKRRRAWTSWNYLVPSDPQERLAVTYGMNTLQGLETREPLLVTLNHDRFIDESKVIARMEYDHPIYTESTLRSQKRHSEISGHRRTHYCGAYWRYGFHEDGVWSGQRVAAGLGAAEVPVGDPA